MYKYTKYRIKNNKMFGGDIECDNITYENSVLPVMVKYNKIITNTDFAFGHNDYRFGDSYELLKNKSIDKRYFFLLFSERNKKSRKNRL